MDPGPLVGPFARHRHDPAALAAPDSNLAQFKPTPTPGLDPRAPLRTVEGLLVQGQSTGLAPTITAPAQAPSISPRAPLPLRPVPANPAGLRPSPAPSAPAPWIPYERAPAPQPRPLALVIEPRFAAPAPFLADPGEAPARPQPPPQRRPTVHERPQPAAKPAPAPRPRHPTAPANGKFDIESISQIGPLAPHFPSRRRFRLRFR
jgi:hypothetical protein